METEEFFVKVMQAIEAEQISYAQLTLHNVNTINENVSLGETYAYRVGVQNAFEMVKNLIRAEYKKAHQEFQEDDEEGYQNVIPFPKGGKKK